MIYGMRFSFHHITYCMLPKCGCILLQATLYAFFFVIYLLPVHSNFCKKTFYTKNWVQIFMIPMCKTVLWVPTNHTMQTLLYSSQCQKTWDTKEQIILPYSARMFTKFLPLTIPLLCPCKLLWWDHKHTKQTIILQHCMMHDMSKILNFYLYHIV